jgi:hypothetical protein
VTLVLLVSLTLVKWRITVLRDFSRFFQFPIITDNRQICGAQKEGLGRAYVVSSWRRGACPVWEMEAQQRLASLGEKEEQAGWEFYSCDREGIEGSVG